MLCGLVTIMTFLQLVYISQYLLLPLGHSGATDTRPTISMSSHQHDRRAWYTGLDASEPGTKLSQSLLPLCDVPETEVDGTVRQETLVCAPEL